MINNHMIICSYNYIYQLSRNWLLENEILIVKLFIANEQHNFSHNIFGTNGDTKGLQPTTMPLEKQMLLPVFIAGWANTPLIWIQFIPNHKIISNDNHH